MDVNKIDVMRQFMMDNDLNFIEKANGHFQVFDEDQKLRYQVWATTEKLLGTEGQSAIGIGKIQRILTARWSGRTHPVATTTEAKPASDIRAKFLNCYENNKGHMFDCILVVAVHQPNGGTSIITDSYEVESKMQYYIDAYDEEFKLKRDPGVQVVGFLLV